MNFEEAQHCQDGRMGGHTTGRIWVCDVATSRDVRVNCR